MKSSKASGFIVLVITLIFAVLGTVFVLIKEPVSPVTVIGTPTATKSGGQIIVTFSLKNESENDVKITYVFVEVSTNHRTESADGDTSITIKAGASEKLSYGYYSSYYPEKVNEISVRADGEKYNVYGGSSAYKTGAFILYLFAVIFAVLTVVSFVGASKQQKRYKAIEQELSNRFGGSAVFVLGAYSKKGEGGKAAAKTAMSVAGGALFAGLFGFGAFKVYGGNAAKEFVITDEGLFIGNPLRKGFNLGNMTYFAKGTFPESQIEVKKNNVIMNNVSSGEFFIFNLTRNSGITANELAEKLTALTMPIDEKSQSEIFADSAETINENHTDDPFDI